MIHTWPVSLLTFVIIILQICSGCQDNCCHSSTNCWESTKCYETSNCCQQNNCCQQTNCRQTTTCQRSNCCRICDTGCRSQSCATECKQRCCQNEDCGTSPTPTTSTRQTPRTPSYYPPSPTPAKLIEHGGSSSNINNGSVQATIGMTNNLTNVNYINIPINITSYNSQSLQIISIPAAEHFVTPIPNVPSTTIFTETTEIEHTSSNSIPSIRTSTTPFPTPPPETVPVAVPVPVYIPVYRTISFPYVVPQQGCCRVFSPCISGQNWNCNPYQTMCGSQCTHNTMYAAMNPCENGCNKRPYAASRSCTIYGYCQVVMKNCDLCNNDFYTNYNSYQNCGGCFYK